MTGEDDSNTPVSVFCNRRERKTALVVADCAGKETTITLDPACAFGSMPFVDSNKTQMTNLSAKPPWSISLAPYEVIVICLDDAEAV